MFNPTDAQITEAAWRAAVETVRGEAIADPDPRPVIYHRVLNGTLRPDLTTFAEVAFWQDREAARQGRLAALAARSGTRDEDEDGGVVVEGQVTGSDTAS